MAYQRKTEDEYSIQGYYDDDNKWEEVTCETKWKLARETLKEYRENEPGIPFRIVKRRVKIETENKQEQVGD